MEEPAAMPTTIGENLAKKKLAAGELVLCLGVNQMRIPTRLRLQRQATR